MARRTAFTAAIGVVVLTVAGCDVQGPKEDTATTPPARPQVSVDTAQATYSPLLATLAHEISATSGHDAPRVEREVIYYDDDLESCAYVGHLSFDDVVFGSDMPWNDVRSATEDSVTPEGFTLSGQLDIPGGYNGFDATAADGGTIEVRSKSATPSTVTLTAPVTGTCPSEVGQTLEPLDQ